MHILGISTISVTPIRPAEVLRRHEYLARFDDDRTYLAFRPKARSFTVEDEPKLVQNRSAKYLSIAQSRGY